jgi:DNA-binding transcriptional LysR family regulator
MDTRRLKHFLAVYDSHSIGQAAEALRLSQPALSKSIRHLESDLGIALFERTPQGVMPTVFGETLALHARVVEAELRRAEHSLADLRGRGRGKASVGIGPSMVPHLMPAVTARLAETCPGVQIVVVEGLVDQLLPMLRRGEIDIAVGSWPRPTDPDLAAEKLCTDAIRVLCSASHKLAGRPVTLADLLDYPWVLPPESQRWRQRMNEVFLARSLAAPQPSVVSNSASFITALLMHGQYLSFLPTLVAKGRGANLITLECDLVLESEVTFTTRARIRKSPAVQAVISVLREVAALPIHVPV